MVESVEVRMNSGRGDGRDGAGGGTTASFGGVLVQCWSEFQVIGLLLAAVNCLFFVGIIYGFTPGSVFWEILALFVLFIFTAFIGTVGPTLLYSTLMSVWIMLFHGAKHAYLSALAVSCGLVGFIFLLMRELTDGKLLGGQIWFELSLISCYLAAGLWVTARMVWRVRNDWERFRWKAFVEDMFGGRQ